MKKTYFFMAGLPRSGSTLLAAILNQNPNIYASNDSPVCDLMFNTHKTFESSEQYAADENFLGYKKVCSSIIENYYSHIDKKYIIDKQRSWGTPFNLQMIERFITEDVKILCPVRDILEILSSFISLVHKNPSLQSVIDRDISKAEMFFYRPVDDVRCDFLMSPKNPMDQELFSLSQSLLPENKNKFHLIEYNDLTSDPESTIKGVYDFLGLEYFKHDFNNIRQKNKPNDLIYGIEGLHDVRKKLEKKSVDPKSILSPYILSKYKGYEFWR
jgi:sulfotransferase